MLIKKITEGYVTQTFDTDKQEFVSQEFKAGDMVDFEDDDGNGINQADFENRLVSHSGYLPFNMVQPQPQPD